MFEGPLRAAAITTSAIVLAGRDAFAVGERRAASDGVGGSFLARALRGGR